MELRVLRYFLTVAREENISAAADFLHLTQPTLSRQLMELERELGVTLFRRGKRKITLTEEGMLLRKRAEEITELVQKTQAEILAPEEDVKGDIYIGSAETRVMALLAEIIRELQAEYPKIRVNIFSGNADDVTEKLDKGLLDFGLLIQPCNIAKYESIRLPQKDTWGMLMRGDSPLAAAEAVRPEDLWDAPLLASRQRLVSGEVGEWLGKDFEELNMVASYNLIFNASVMVEEGMGYALCLEGLVNTSGDSPLCFRPLEPRLEASLNIVWKKYQVFSRAAELFLEKLRARYG